MVTNPPSLPKYKVMFHYQNNQGDAVPSFSFPDDVSQTLLYHDGLCICISSYLSVHSQFPLC